jgi:hypothetical protein
MALTNKQKQEALRKRRAAAGLKELRGVWIPVGMEEEIREVIRQARAMYDEIGTDYTKPIPALPDEMLTWSGKADKTLALYQHAVNQIDDYFEYSMESKKDQKRVHQVLVNLTDALKHT